LYGSVLVLSFASSLATMPRKALICSLSDKLFFGVNVVVIEGMPPLKPCSMQYDRLKYLLKRPRRDRDLLQASARSGVLDLDSLRPRTELCSALVRAVTS
jgi:hypothetical protein